MSRLRILSGDPSAEEIAAIVVALDPARRPAASPAAAPGSPAWARAARREALGGPPVASPQDLRGPG